MRFLANGAVIRNEIGLEKPFLRLTLLICITMKSRHVCEAISGNFVVSSPNLPHIQVGLHWEMPMTKQLTCENGLTLVLLKLCF